ncbi:toll/interleukin-1 receptor domain-containing protein [Butyrivibrio sp. INlla16]|uniref:toll/interleukin-1 receptor domain-containing protein n=1 Tax=Butyrivibrio sp. INlla16 TaxID=1520807 RepID=UPI00088E6F56|nr:toll/interleukin-1 receptor domain-containing protein [Butyrivibrio sp. INlla16]SDB63124.1 TIR domain-containing protein [Butyrivibrio sp. INlla16]
MASNRALIKENFVFEGVTRSNEKCVFISHKKEDEAAAKYIGDYIMEHANVDIYLDLYDTELKEAVSTENDKKIVESIKRGLRTSTHILCVISDKTHLSWWVPYEIGVASENKKSIASLKLKNISDLPSFLKTEQVLMTSTDFVGYVDKLNPFHIISESMMHNSSKQGLKQYLH